MEPISTSETSLHIMVLYDGLSAGLLAKQICDRICGRLPNGAEARLSLWRFDSMLKRGTEGRAYGDLREADVLLVAADGCQRLPQAVQKALDKWLAKGPVPFGLVLILYGVEEAEKELSPTHSYLESLARKTRTDFFSQAIAAPAQNGESALISIRRPLTVDFVWDEDSFAMSVPIAHWGINE